MISLATDWIDSLPRAWGPCETRGCANHAAHNVEGTAVCTTCVVTENCPLCGRPHLEHECRRGCVCDVADEARLGTADVLAMRVAQAWDWLRDRGFTPAGRVALAACRATPEALVSGAMGGAR